MKQALTSTAVFCGVWLYCLPAQAELAQSIFEQHDPNLHERLEVSVDQCVIKTTITRPNTCDGKPVQQAVEKRVDLTEIASIEVKTFRGPEPFYMSFNLITARPSRLSVLWDQIVHGEEEAWRRYQESMDIIDASRVQSTGTYFAQCDGSLSRSARRSAVFFLIDRPTAWDDLVLLAKSCGVSSFKDTYTKP